MRENMCLCRGKRKDNLEWIEGYYFRYGNTGQERHYIMISYDRTLYGVEVIPETVGECVNVPDKNGKQIFEGDILEFVSMNDVPHWFRFDKHVVKYESGYAGFRPLCEYDSDCGESVESSNVIVIGNIHDNPELLQEAQHD